jgi:hypothetical protein
MNRTIYLLALFLLLLAMGFVGFRWSSVLAEGKSIIILIGLLPLFCLVICKGALIQGRTSIEREMHRTGILNLRGPEAVAAGRRLIVLGRCILYFGLGLSWIFFILYVVR